MRKVQYPLNLTGLFDNRSSLTDFLWVSRPGAIVTVPTNASSTQTNWSATLFPRGVCHWLYNRGGDYLHLDGGF